MENKTYKIGRNPSNDIVISQPQISGNHATITKISNNTALLEDVGSLGGTYVDGVKIKRKVITPTNQVTLANININLSKFFKPPPPKLHSPKEIQSQFLKLKDVYYGYLHNKEELRKNLTKRNSFIKASLAFIPIVGLPLIYLVSPFLDPREKLSVLDEEFKQSYVCPNGKCHRFLGNIPWENYYKKQKCDYCGTRWVE